MVAVAAFLCGMVNALAGGGSLVLFPALVATGMGSLAANVTNSVITLPGYVGGAVGFRSEIESQRTALRPLLAATILGSTTGCLLLLATDEAVFERLAPALVALASVLIGAQPWLARRLTRDDRPTASWAPVVGVVLASVYGGYFGAGLGVLLLAVLGLTIHAPLVRLSALRTALSVADASVSLVVFGWLGPVVWSAVAVGAPLTLVGGYVGAKAARRVTDQALRTVVVAVGLVAALGLWLW